MSAVVQKAVGTVRLKFLAVNAQTGIQLPADALQCSDFFHVRLCGIVICRKTPLVVHHYGNALFFRRIRNHFCFTAVQCDRFFKNHKARTDIYCLQTFL